jgi:hypothetical protein
LDGDKMIAMLEHARRKRNAKRMAEKIKELEKKWEIDKMKTLPAVLALRAIGATQHPGKAILQCYADTEHTKLLAVAMLDQAGIDDLYKNLNEAASIKE